MGERPDHIDPAIVSPCIEELLESQTLLLDGHLAIPFVWARDLQWHDESLPYHPNAMTLVAHGHSDELYRNVFYSVGGGFVVDQGRSTGMSWMPTPRPCPTISTALLNC